MAHSRNDPDKHSTYMDGIPVKISELYKPPKKITLPVGIANRQPIENFEKYDFRLERSTAEKMAKLRELRRANIEKRRQRIAAEDKKLEELKNASSAETTSDKSTAAATVAQSPESIPTQETAKYVSSSSTCVTEHMLTPVPVNQPMAHQHQVISNFDPIKGGINISDFESDSSPFDNMELKTLNDIAELASVLQPNNEASSRAVAHSGYQSYNQQDNHQSLYGQPTAGYGIKPSRQFIQNVSVVQPHNMLPTNGYNNGRINGLYNTSLSDSFWNCQQTVSYTSARTTPSFVYGGSGVATSEYGPGNSGYTAQNSDYTPEVGASSEYGPELGGFAARGSEFTPGNSEYSSKIGASSDYGPKISGASSEYGPKIGENTGYSTQNSEYTSRNSQYMPTSSDYSHKIGNTSEYAPKFGSHGSRTSDYTSNIGGTSEYTPHSRGTSNYMPRTSDYSMSKIDGTSEFTPKIGGTKPKVGDMPKMEYAPVFSWTTYNYQPQRSPYDTANNSIYVPSVSQAKVDTILQQASDSSVESRLSVNSGVTDLIRELKLELDDKRENDSRKIMENERILATSTALENDKLKQKLSKIVPSPATPQLPNPINQLTPSCKNLVHRIAEMGFAEARVARAVSRLGDNETKVLEFLLQIQRLEEESGCPGERVEQALIANRYDSVETARYLEILQQLLDLGFVETKVTEALAQHSNDRDKAIESLIS